MVRSASVHASDHGFLWRISKDGHASYLYGTIHVAKFVWAFPGPMVKQAIGATDTMAVEIDMLDPDIRMRTIKGMEAFPAVTLPDALVLRIKKQAQAECVPYDMLARLPPVFQVENLSLVEGRRDGLEAEYAIDAMLASIGHAQGKAVVSLETPESQLGVLKSPSAQETLALLQDDLDELEKGSGRKYLARIAGFWESSNYEQMSHYQDWCNCMDTEAERNFMKHLLDERNPAMAARIDQLHADGKKVFVAVGSLHMFGPLGLPSLMRKRGYQVERIDLARDPGTGND